MTCDECRGRGWVFLGNGRTAYCGCPVGKALSIDADEATDEELEAAAEILDALLLGGIR